ncbi:hypothetical protein CHLRE_01g029350v5 [Chlamydomonas reinhardtii]|uniref:Uncharacterized protein n=1 Tax=Chlamydomonas reinhardtii TaxID=3055 RepID=A0A2K3E6N2_CHLRE|nr:uncharacterized protein CHLRE_01g029350v5 [Chlamydomonas reinhardtii]PNW88434.1 hypothetical protein CHLRE_01g029350v5 [Chlamydomonas reinhardtii]7N6G_1Q Chain 1Q, FAP297 [Chlamydomonas reinhardtii]7SQC_2H Chain 2H, FAP297 [Chlamydomonas reinhardtii]7SQC_2I Chain 2I, FAP297 [Chlamydomonas reinhardtii]
MPPLPTLWDPAGAVDKLPQPFRMIDKILADIVEQVVDMIGTRESQRRAEDASRVDLTFAPHAVMEVAPETCCFLPIGIAGIAAVAMPDGEVQVRSARDPSICFSDRTHTSPVTAMEAGMAVCTSGRLLAAASRTALTLHEVDIKTCEISLLATVPLPADPDDTSPPVRLHWSDNLGHLAVCRRSGALALFTLSLPPPNVSLESVGAFVALSLKAFGETRVEELLRVPAATVRAFCLGSAAVGPSNLVWQLQQRPDKSPHSDRYHKSARGAYVWWEGANRLLLLDFEAAAGAAAAAGGAGGAVVPPPEVEAAVKAGAAGTSKPSTPATKAASSKSVAPPGEASSLLTASASAAAAAYAGPERPPEVPQIAPMARDWLLPHDVTAAATTSDHKTMAWGLADGSVVIWDDRSCCSTKVLPRLKGGITALSWVNGVAHKLVCASAGGHIFIADVIKPEDSSQKPYEFPQAIHEVHTLPNEPFALCICRGHTSSDGEIASTHRGGRGGPSILSTMSGHGPGGGGHDVMRVPPQRPRVFWYNVLEEKPVAELMGPRAEQGFGLACCVPPPPSLAPPPPRPDTAATDAGAADGKSAAASAAATPAPGAAPKGKGGAAAPAPPSGGGGGGAAPAASQEAPSEPAMSEAQRALIKAALDAMGANSTTPVLVPVKLHVPAGQVVSYPACVFRDTYLLAGGDVVDKVVRSNFADDDAVPQRVTQLYMYKVDALLRHLLPEDESTSRLGKVVLDRLLADLEAPKMNRKKGKRVKMDVEDPDAPKLSSAMRKPDPFDTTGSRPGSRAANRHITFGGGDADGLFDDVLEGGRAKPKKETKVFPKETKKGLKTGPGDVKMIDKNASGRPRLAPLDLEKAKEAPLPFSERSQSPPWHHTNPLARIHPDWEEAPVLVRIMDRIGSKGGGRKRRDKRLEALTTELMTKYSKEAGAKPNLLVPT